MIGEDKKGIHNSNNKYKICGEEVFFSAYNSKVSNPENLNFNNERIKLQNYCLANSYCCSALENYKVRTLQRPKKANNYTIELRPPKWSTCENDLLTLNNS